MINGCCGVRTSSNVQRSCTPSSANHVPQHCIAIPGVEKAEGFFSGFLAQPRVLSGLWGRRSVPPGKLQILQVLLFLAHGPGVRRS